MTDPRSTVNWALQALRTSPTAWCALLGSLGLVPLLAAARSGGILTADSDLSGLAVDSMRSSALIGACLGLGTASMAERLLQRVGAGDRLLAEFVLVSTPALVLGLTSSVGALLAGVGTAHLPALAATAFHAGAAGTLALRVPGPRFVRGAVLIVGLLVLPTRLQGSGWSADVLQGVLDPFMRGSGGSPLAPLVAGTALLLTAYLIPTPRPSAV